MYINKIFFFICIILSLFSACSNSNDSSPQIAIYAYNDGNGISLKYIFALNNRNDFYEEPQEIIELTSPSESINPYTGFSRGDFLLFTDDKKAITYGSYYKTNKVIKEEERTLTPFRCVGEENSFGEIKGSIFAINADELKIIGECAYQKAKTPEEGERIFFVSRFLHSGSKWMFASGDKIFELNEDKTINQVGWISWRTWTDPDGKPLIVLMTKGMGENSRWMGRFNGKVYQDVLPAKGTK